MKTHTPKQHWAPISLAETIRLALARVSVGMYRRVDALGVDRRWIYRRGFIPFALVSGCASLLAGLFLPIGVTAGALYVGIVLMSLWSPHRYAALWLAGCATVLLLVAFSWSLDNRSGTEVLVDRVLALMILWVMAAFSYLHKRHDTEREHLIRNLADGLAKVKTLQGLLPICVSCKKVRDEHDRWHGIESYLEAHSEAITSRVVCPDCRRTWPSTLAAG